MALFTSEFECKLDTKGRLALPAKVKANLPEVSSQEVVLMRGFERCIELYPIVEFKKKQLQFSSLSDYDPEQRKLKRAIFKRVANVELDSAGRILIPKAMLAYANINREAVLIGIGTSVEIWNPQVFETESMADTEYSELAQKFLDE